MVIILNLLYDVYSYECCNLSPLLFNIYIEQATNECKEYCTGIKVNGVRIQMLRFADDSDYGAR